MPTVPQIRINRSQEVENVLSFLKTKYTLLDESEIVKLALSDLFNNQMKDIKLDNPLHPYYSKLTPEEEIGVVQSKKDIKASKSNILKSSKDIETYFANL